MPNTPSSGIAINDEDIKEQTSAFSDVGERVGSVPDCITGLRSTISGISDGTTAYQDLQRPCDRHA